MKILSMFLMAGTILTATPITSTQITLKNEGAPLLSDGQSYVGPYTVTVNGIDYGALSVDAIHSTDAGTIWSAYINDIPLETSHTYNPSNLTGYEEEAYLYSLLMQPNADRTDIQHAAWHILDSHYQVDSAAQSFITLAQANYASVNLAGFQVLSSAGGQRQEEFLIYNAAAVPEPNTVLLLAGGLLFTAGLVRRKARRERSTTAGV